MQMGFKLLNEFDVIFISYDEDNCEEHWADLQSKVPWAKRVHGVRGSDAAHKAAANTSDTEIFISIDADNIIDTTFFDMELDLDHPKLQNKAISWTSKNHINGLEYGNGGIKLWPKSHVLSMKSHEASNSDDKRSQIEFCWDNNYMQMANQYSTTYPNGSPRQAFRAGFREGVKMSLDRGEKLADPAKFKDVIWHGNYKRLITWCSVGADVENGEWAMYGARLGCVMTNLSDWDYVNVRDFDYLNNLFNTEVSRKFTPDLSDPSAKKCYKTGLSWSQDLLTKDMVSLGDKMRRGMGIEVAELSAVGSKFYKAAQYNVPRMNKMFTEEELTELRRLNR